jgi:hypothetical protein
MYQHCPAPTSQHMPVVGRCTEFAYQTLISCLLALGTLVCEDLRSTSHTARTKSNNDLEGLKLSSTALDMESHLGTATALEATYNDRRPRSFEVLSQAVKLPKLCAVACWRTNTFLGC